MGIMKANIEIETQTCGKTTRFRASGSVERRDGGVLVSYPIEGDLSTLELYPSCAVLQRRGEVRFDATFRENEGTLFRMSLRDGAAELPILTKHYKSFISDPEIFCRLSYDLQTDKMLQRFSLRIRIKVFSEEQ